MAKASAKAKMLLTSIVKDSIYSEQEMLIEDMLVKCLQLINRVLLLFRTHERDLFSKSEIYEMVYLTSLLLVSDSWALIYEIMKMGLLTAMAIPKGFNTAVSMLRPYDTFSFVIGEREVPGYEPLQSTLPVLDELDSFDFAKVNFTGNCYISMVNHLKKYPSDETFE